MGNFHPEVTVKKELKRLVKPRRGTKRKGGRDADEMSVVTVREMSLGPAVGGEIIVRSSNTFTPTLGAGWSKLTREHIEKRLRDSDGGPKGRILFAELHCLNAEPVVVCAVCFHIERTDEILIKSFDVSGDVVSHRAKLFDAMLLAIERVACESNSGRAATVAIDVASGDALWFKDNFDFRQLRDHPYGKNRRIIGTRGNHVCRPPKGKPAVRELVAAQQTASR